MLVPEPESKPAPIQPEAPSSTIRFSPCIHIAHPDAERLIPFDTFNLFYRDDLEQTCLAPLREQVASVL